MNQPGIRILLVDDHAVVREGYRRLIEKHQGLTVVAEAADGIAAYQIYKEHQPDVVVLDLSMPGKSGIEVIRHLRQRDEAARILVFTMHQNSAYALQAFQAGARGYITKSSAPELLISAIRDVAAGKKPISPDISHALALMRIDPESLAPENLTAREFDIFRMIADAKPIAEIAETLNLSAKTVSNYHYLIKSKLGVSSDVELVHLAMRLKIIDPDKVRSGG
jgi:two-component system, NarL family, invasion response regulator UvrY